MSFYSINQENFPIIKIVLKGDITDKALNEFFDIWLSFYKKKKKFYLLFDICNVNNPSIKHGFQLAKFIQTIKPIILETLIQNFLVMI